MTATEIRSIYHQGTRLDLFYSYPQNLEASSPTVLIFSPWSGRTRFTEHKAHLMAQMGYIGIAVDLFGESKTGETRDECSSLIAPFLKDRHFLKDRMAAIIEHVKQDSQVDKNKIFAFGYCFGGLCVLDAVRSNLGLCAGVSIHGLYSKPTYDLPSTYTAKVLTLHGYKDPMITKEDVRHLQQELQTASVDWQMIIYGKGYHAFTTPGANDPDFGTVFDACLDERTAVYLNAFLKEVLG